VRPAVEALLVAACVLGGLRLRPDRALLLLAAVVVLLPASLQLPNGVTPLPTATRLTALAIGINLLQRGGWRLLRATPLHRAAGVYAGITLLTGVLLAPAERPLGATASSWLALVDPLLVGLVGLGCVRVAGSRAALRALAVVALVAVAAGVLEHATGSPLSRFLIRTDGLEQRSGTTRIRVGSDFALAFAWTLAALLPFVVVLLRRRVVGVVLGLGTGLLVEYWTFSRSVPLGLALGLLVLVVALRDARLAALLLAAALVLGIVADGTPAVRARFSAAVDQGAINVRSERAPQVLDAASRRPVIGLGLGGVALLGIGETDESFLLSYAELGVLGLVAQLVLLGCGLVLCGRGVRGPPSPARSAAAASLAGALVLTLAALAFDAFSIRGTAALLGLLLGVGAAAAEQVAGPAPIARPSRDLPALRVLAVGLAAAAGMLVSLSWPSHVALTAQFATLSPAALAEDYDRVDEGRRLIATACAVATAPQPGLTVRCSDSNLAAGVGGLRLEGGSTADLFASLTALVNRVRTQTAVHGMSAVPDHQLIRSVPTPAGTAPWSFGLLAALLALLVPTEPVRRLQARTRSWRWRVDGSDLLARPVGPFGAEARIAEQGDHRRPEAAHVGEGEAVGREALGAGRGRQDR
jgi:hypothetical protein